MTQHSKRAPKILARAPEIINLSRAAVSELILDPPPLSSDSRDGHISWSLYGNSGSQTVQSVGPFQQRDTNFYGTEGPPGEVGTSRYIFGEEVEFFTANGTITFGNGTVQKVSGRGPVMNNAGQLWSGKLKDQVTIASAQHYITLTIRRQSVGGTKFHLAIFGIFRAFDGNDNIGFHTLRVYNDSTGALLAEQNVPLATPPSGLSCVYEISDLVGVGDFIRVELISQLALSNSSDPQPPPVDGGSICGLFFLDNVA